MILRSSGRWGQKQLGGKNVGQIELIGPFQLPLLSFFLRPVKKWEEFVNSSVPDDLSLARTDKSISNTCSRFRIRQRAWISLIEIRESMVFPLSKIPALLLFRSDLCRQLQVILKSTFEVLPRGARRITPKIKKVIEVQVKYESSGKFYEMFKISYLSFLLQTRTPFNYGRITATKITQLKTGARFKTRIIGTLFPKEYPFPYSFTQKTVALFVRFGNSSFYLAFFSMKTNFFLSSPKSERKKKKKSATFFSPAEKEKLHMRKCSNFYFLSLNNFLAWKVRIVDRKFGAFLGRKARKIWTGFFVKQLDNFCYLNEGVKM